MPYWGGSTDRLEFCRLRSPCLAIPNVPWLLWPREDSYLGESWCSPKSLVGVEFAKPQWLTRAKVNFSSAGKTMQRKVNKQAKLTAPTGALGSALKGIRSEQGLTLAEVARKTGIAVSTLSKVENGKLSLNYERLIQISRGLQVDITRLFEEKEMPRVLVARRSINRKGEGRIIETRPYRHFYLSTDLVGKKFDPILGEIKARTIEEFGEFVRHEGEEFAFVVSGQVEFHSEFYEPVLLEEGDSIYFDSSMGHAYLARSDEPCRVLSACIGGQAGLQRGDEVALKLVSRSAESTES